jgi:serine/threonine protein kinase
VKTILVSSMFWTGLDACFSAIRTIEIEDAPIGGGGFGVVYRMLSIDGRSCPPQVIKILLDTMTESATRGFATIQELQRRLANKHQAYTQQGSSLIQRHPSLLAVPQFSFRGMLDGHPVVGYGANDLTAAGLESFGGILNDDAKTMQLQTLPLHARLALAAQLVDAFDLLSTHLQYIHADLKAEAVFVDLQTQRCAVIDFDSGAAARHPGDTPSTFGTKQDWLAPEIVQQLDQVGNANRAIRVDLYSDVWSLAIGVHYLLFGCHPLFFLSELSDRSVDAYFKRFKWPNVDPSFSFFVHQYAAGYQVYRQALRTLPREIERRLEITVNMGYQQPSRRITVGQWKAILGAANRPAIVEFAADPPTIVDRRPVRLSWSVTGAAKLSISGVGDVTYRAFADVQVRRDTVFTLTLTPPSGPPISQSAWVTVSKAPPVIHVFQTSRALLHRAEPARLSWQVQGADCLTIDNGVGDVTHLTHVDVLPRRDTIYRLTATSPFGVTSTATVDIRVSAVAPIITRFWADRNLLIDRPTVELAWDVSSDADVVTLDPVGRVARTGRQTVRQFRATEYVLTATSYFGRSSETRLRVEVSNQPPIIRAFAVTPVRVRRGGLVRVAWEVEGASHVELVGLATGLRSCGESSVSFERSAAVEIRATTLFGVVASEQVKVRVIAPITLRTPTPLRIVPRPLRKPRALRAPTPRWPGGATDDEC